MRVAVSFLPESVAELVECARESENAGFAHVGVGDSQSLYRELWVCSGLVAAATTRVGVGPRVTNPVTRHPAVTASAIATLDEVSNGRAFLGLGTGDSAVLNVEARPARLDELRSYTLAVRDLLTGGEATYGGRKSRLTWARRCPPIYLAVAGPKGLRLAGEIADGVIAHTGFRPENVADTLERIEAGARASGRRLSDVDVWWLALVSQNDTVEAAYDLVRPSLAAYAHSGFAAGLADRQIPPDLADPVQRLVTGYRHSEHAKPGAERPNARLVRELGLTEYLASRFALCGPPDAIRAQAQAAERTGASQLWLTVHYADKLGFIRSFRDVLQTL
ncbi:MAG: LLM class flavin-dependent oxidoreductase [Chloroflexi bacterium]|nr:LLM class flavin-dependent oxidoreductase [Chloroflexota bacterium]